MIVEVDAPGAGWRRIKAWFEWADHRGGPFDWAVVGADAIAEVAARAGLVMADVVQLGSGRCFAHLGPAK